MASLYKWKNCAAWIREVFSDDNTIEPVPAERMGRCRVIYIACIINSPDTVGGGKDNAARLHDAFANTHDLVFVGARKHAARK